MAARSSIDLNRDPQAIIATRETDTPRELVCRMWRDVWRFVMHGPDGRDYYNRVTFDEIVKPKRLRYRHGGGEDVEPVQFRTTVTFEDLDSGRTRITLHAVFPSAAERERVIREHGAAKGAEQTLSRLADYVATTA